MQRIIDETWRAVLTFVALTAFAVVVTAQAKQDPPGTQYPTGLIPPKDLEARIARSWIKHARAIKALPTVTADKYDARELGLVGPIKNQGNCGSCYTFSAVGPAETAFVKAGHGKAESFILSEQNLLDCYNVGGCGGGWPEECAAIAKEKGLPLTADYGPYEARSGRCKPSTKLFRIDDYGYVGSSSGVPSAQAIKDAMIRYGPISVCVAADNALSNYRGGIFKGNGRSINHAVMLVGWRMEGGKTIWIMRNSWGTGWGMNGYAEMEEGANQIGDSALWVYVAGAPVPPDPDPIPPVPPDPVPPGPGGTEWRFDPITKKIHVPAGWKVTGGDVGGDMLDMTGVPPDVAALIRALVEAQRKKAADTLPRTMPRTIPKASIDPGPLPLHFAFADLSVLIVPPVPPEVKPEPPVPYTPPDPPPAPKEPVRIRSDQSPAEIAATYAAAVKAGEFLVWFDEVPVRHFGDYNWSNAMGNTTVTISGPHPNNNGRHVTYTTLQKATVDEVYAALAASKAYRARATEPKALTAAECADGAAT